MPIAELGHVGLFVDDLDLQRDFYTRVLGLTVTDEDRERGIVFLSARPGEEHHELVLCRTPGGSAHHAFQQVSFRCVEVGDVLDFNRRFLDEPVRFERTVTHGNAVSIYFYDPEGNRCEVYWRTGLAAKQPFAVLIDLSQSEGAILAAVRGLVDEYGTTGTPLDMAQLDPAVPGPMEGKDS